MKKLFLLGLDGATWTNLMPWITSGELPFFKKIIDNGGYTTSKTTIPCLTCPALPSFYTGKNPAKHGLLGFRKANGNIINSNDVKEPKLWDILGESGIKSIVCGLRTTFPPKIKNGVLISSLLAPSPESNFVYPHSEKKYFKKFISKPEVKPSLEDEEIYNNILENTKIRLSLFWSYIGKNKFDFILFYNGNTDTIQHKLWHRQDLILKYYKFLDGFFQKKLLKENLIVFSDHGFEKTFDKALSVNTVLKNLGYLYEANYIKRKLEFIYRKLYFSCGWFLRNHLPRKIYEYIFKIVQKTRNSSNSDYPKTIEVPLCNINNFGNKTTAFMSHKWGITIAKKNLEEDYELFREKLIKKLKNEKGPDKKPIFRDVLKKEDIYKEGKYLKFIPDVIFLTSQQYEARPAVDKNTVSNLIVKRRVPGIHENMRDAIFIAHGPEMKKQGDLLKNIQIYDIMPTILHFYGVPISTDLDGEVLKEIFKDDSEVKKATVKYKKNDQISDIVSEIRL